MKFRLVDGPGGDWASFVPMIGAWSDERISIGRGDGPGLALAATARPTSDVPADAPTGPGIFALRWFVCAQDDAGEFADLSARAWPAFEAATPGTRVFGLFRAAVDGGSEQRFLLCTRYPSLAAWESSRAETGTPEFRRRAELTQRTRVSVWRLAG